MTSKNSKEKQMEEMIESFKLLPTAKPPLFHYHTVRGNVSAYLWQKKVRPVVLEQLDKTCSICGWQPTIKEEERKLHLHEIEEYDYENMVCHLMDIQLICAKCHAIQHIMRAQSVLTMEQWDDLMQHFIMVNGCSSDVLDDWELLVTKSMQRDKNLMTMPALAERKELTKKTRRYTVASHLPFAEEMINQLSKKGLLHHESFVEKVIEDYTDIKRANKAKNLYRCPECGNVGKKIEYSTYTVYEHKVYSTMMGITRISGCIVEK